MRKLIVSEFLTLDEGFAEAWLPRSGPFADKMNSMPQHVASTTLRDLEWNNSTLLSDDVVAAVTELKQGDGGPILVAGSCTLELADTQTFDSGVVVQTYHPAN